MKAFKLFYNGLIWGLLVSVLAFQSQWLEMRMNIGIFIPIILVLTFIAAFVYKIVRKTSLVFNIRFTAANLVISFILSLLITGFERIKVIPASNIRELLKIPAASFAAINMALLLFLFAGLIVIGYSEARSCSKA